VAGLNVVLAMEKEWGSLAGRQVLVFCGKGRNGGDGMVAARHLVNQGASAVVLVAGPESDLSAEAAAQMAVLKKQGLETVFISGEGGLELAKALFKRADFVVDALYGSGFKGVISGLPAALVQALNASGTPVLSVDLPSGLDADTGAVRGACVRAALTVSFTLPKLGLALQPGRSYTGKLLVADIGIPVALASGLSDVASLFEVHDLKPLLPRRSPLDHKKSVGTLLLVAGSKEYAGAAILAARAAFKSGAGFVHLLVPEALRAQMQSAVPEAVVHERSLAKALELAKSSQAAVVGPGLGRIEAELELARQLFAKLEIPALFDADALFALAGPAGKELKAAPGAARLLTPHDGEMERLASGPAEERLMRAGRYAQERGLAVLLKGPASAVFAPGKSPSFNATGSAALATAGSGDVLAGLAGALMAQGLAADMAARAAACLHGLAADLRVEQAGETGLTAGELIEFLPMAFSQARGKA
jgi:NAD(P)H-hydrate epimerase